MAAAERAARSHDIGRVATELPRRAREAAPRTVTPIMWILFGEMAALLLLVVGMREYTLRRGAL